MSSVSTLLPGLGLRLLAVFLVTAMSVVIHALGNRVALGQIIFWRSAVALLPILAYAFLRHQWLGTRRPGLHLLRSLFGVASMAFSFVSFIYLPVSNAQALAYLAPVLTLPLAALTLGERITPWVAAAVALGFGGALAMLWEGFRAEGALIGWAAGLAYAVTMAFVRVHIRAMVATESASAVAFYFALAGTAVGALTWPLGWAPLDGGTFALLALAGLLGGLGHIAATEALVRAPVSRVAVMDFTGLVWALGFDLALFGLFPGHWAILGLVAILAAGVIVSLRSQAAGPPARTNEKGRPVGGPSITR